MESLSGIYRGGVTGMDTDSVTGDVDSVQGVSFSVEPPLDGILLDGFCQQQGWVRVYGKFYTRTPQCSLTIPAFIVHLTSHQAVLQGRTCAENNDGDSTCAVLILRN